MKLKVIIGLWGLWIIFFTMPAWSNGDKEGNGGDVVICRNEAKEIISIELLDFYEARARNIQTSLGDPSLSVSDKIQIALKRLEKLDPFRFNLYKTGAQDFEQKAVFRDDVELADIPDSKHLFFPKNCKVEQIVIRVNRKDMLSEDSYWLPEGKKYLVNANLWNHPLFGNDSKAGLILHELIYEDSSHSSSERSRYFNSYLTSTKMNGFSIPEYLQFLKMNVFIYYVYLDFCFQVDDDLILFENSDKIKAGILLNGKLSINGKEIRIGECKVELYANGKPRSVNSFYGEPRIVIPILGKDRELVYGESLLFYENGNLKYVELCHISGDSKTGVYVTSLEGDSGHADRVIFNEDGNMESARIVTRVWPLTTRYDNIQVDAVNSQQIDDIVYRVSPISLGLDQETYTPSYDAGQILIIGRAFDSLSISEQKLLQKKLRNVIIWQDQTEPMMLHFTESAGTTLINNRDNTYTLYILFDNNSGEREFVSKEKLLEVFNKIIERSDP